MFRMMNGAVKGTQYGRCAAIDWGEGSCTDFELGKGVIFDIDLILPTMLALRLSFLRLVVWSACAGNIKWTKNC